MGITGFWPFIKEELDTKAYKTITMQDLKGKTLLFDTKGLIYKVKQGPQGIQLYLGNFIRIVHECLKYNIEPIFIMDGIPPKSKQFVNKKRKESREKRTNEIIELQERLKDAKKDLGVPIYFEVEELRDMSYDLKKDDLDRLTEIEISLTQKVNGTNMVSDDDVAQVYFLLERMGCWVIRGHGEGEALCAYLNRLGYGYAVVSDDSDSFPFGAKKLIRNWNLQGKKSMEDPEAGKMKLYDCDLILKELGIDIDQLIEICILCGNDFSNGVKPAGFGFKTSFLAIKELGLIDKALDRKVKENFIKKRKKLFEIPKEFEPEVPRKEFYTYAKFSELFSYIKKPEKLEWKPEEIVSFLKSNKMSILIPTFCNVYQYVFGKELYTEDISPNFEKEIKLPSAPSLTIEENLKIDTLVEKEFGAYREKYLSSSSKEEVLIDESPKRKRVTKTKSQEEKTLQVFEEETLGNHKIKVNFTDSKDEFLFIKPIKSKKPVILND